MSIHVTSINGMGSAIISGSSVVTQGMRAEDHMHMSRDFLLQAGVVKAADLGVAQNGTPNRSVNVSAGVCYVLNPNFTDNSNAHAKYFNVTNDATANVAINTNTAGNPRYTSIFMKVDLSATPGNNGENSATLVAVDGTAAASPVAPNAPSDGNCYLRLADVYCANGFSSIVNANITDKRVFSTIANMTPPANNGKFKLTSAKTTNSVSMAKIDNSYGVTLNVLAGRLVVVILKVGGVYNSNTSREVDFDIGLDGTTITSTSGYYACAYSDWQGNWATNGTATVSYTMNFYFTGVTPGAHVFYPLWLTSNADTTAGLAQYSVVQLSCFELI